MPPATGVDDRRRDRFRSLDRTSGGGSHDPRRPWPKPRAHARRRPAMSRSCSPTTRRSRRSTKDGAATTSRPMCCHFRRRRCPARTSRAHLGDIVIAFETMAAEAERDGKPFAHHLAHLAVHGYLHLLGHDHDNGSRRRGDGAAGDGHPGAHRRARSLCRPRFCARGSNPEKPCLIPNRLPPLPKARDRRSPRNLPVPVPQAIEAPSEGVFTRWFRALFGWRSRLHARRPQGRAGGRRAERNRLLARRKRDAQEYPGLARTADRRRHGSARRHHRRAAGHRARRTRQGVREGRAFAPRRL